MRAKFKTDSDFFLLYLAASHLLFFSLQVPPGTKIFLASLTESLSKKRKKEKGLYFKPLNKFGGKYNFRGVRGFESPSIRSTPPTDPLRYFQTSIPLLLSFRSSYSSRLMAAWGGRSRR